MFVYLPSHVSPHALPLTLILRSLMASLLRSRLPKQSYAFRSMSHPDHPVIMSGKGCLVAISISMSLDSLPMNPLFCLLRSTLPIEYRHVDEAAASATHYFDELLYAVLRFPVESDPG